MFFSPQVWPDFPDIFVNSSLDWDSQVEVKGPLWMLGEVRLPGRHSRTQDTGHPSLCHGRGQREGIHIGHMAYMSACVPITLCVIFYPI